MTGKELFDYLTQDAGLDEATAKAMVTAASNEKVGVKAASLVQKQQYDELERRAAEIELAYNGNGKKLGAKAYQEWYDKNYTAVEALKAKAAQYEERYGSLEAPTGGNPPGKPAAAAAATFTADDVQRMVNDVIQKDYAPRWSNLLTSTGSIVQKHMFNGRKSEIDFKKLEEIAATKGGDLDAAYDEYDRPEREAAAKVAEDTRVEGRVKEELQKRQTQSMFPAGAEGGASTGTSGITRIVSDKKYDRNSVIAAATTGNYDGKVQ